MKGLAISLELTWWGVFSEYIEKLMPESNSSDEMHNWHKNYLFNFHLTCGILDHLIMNYLKYWLVS